MGNTQVLSAEIVEKRLELLKASRGNELVKSGKNCRLIKENWVDAFNKRDMKRVVRSCDRDAMCFFDGAESGMPLDAFMEECGKIHIGFPDFVTTFDCIEEVQPNVVRVTNFKTQGTHTGPFEFGPFPAVPATGIVVDEDPCQLTIEIKHGKMSKFVITMKQGGHLVGPPGYYIAVGGKMKLVEDSSSISDQSQDFF